MNRYVKFYNENQINLTFTSKYRVFREKIKNYRSCNQLESDEFIYPKSTQMVKS